MELQEILSIGVKVLGFAFILAVLIFQFIHMRKSGTGLTPNETAKLIVMASFIYAMIKNGSVDPGQPPYFAFELMGILLGALLGLAGITNWKEIQNLKNGKK